MLKVNTKFLYVIIHTPDTAPHGAPPPSQDLYLLEDTSHLDGSLYSSLGGSRSSSDGDIEGFLPQTPHSSSTIRSTGSSGKNSSLDTHIRKSRKRSLFEDLHSEKGVTNVRKWFEKEALLAPQVTSISAPINPGLTRHSFRVMNQQSFLFFMRRLVDLPDWKILDIFDLFDKEDIGSIKFPEFFLLLALYSAREGRRAKKFLFNHSKALFSLLSLNLNSFSANNPGYRRIGAENFAALGIMFGFSKRALRKKILADFNFDMSTDFISWSDFVDLYFSLFVEYDDIGPEIIIKTNILMDEEDKPLQPSPSKEKTHRSISGKGSGIKSFLKKKSHGGTKKPSSL